MNKSHKSIWNESLGTYVAAAETANATGRKTSSGRKARRVPLRAHAGQLALEQRIVFDAALPATLAEAQAESAAGQDPVLAELDQLEAEDAGVDAAAVQAAVETTEPVSDGPEAAAAVDEDEAETGEAVDVAETGSEAAIDESLEAPVADEPLEGVTETEMVEAVEPERTEIIFVDSIAEGVTEYLDTHPGEVYVLDPDRDGVEQIAEILRDREGVDAIHIVSHGADGQLFLGSGTLNTATLANAYGDEMDVIAAALSDDADILIYGCDVASTEAGVELMQGLSDATGADVAASTDATGAAELGGDWVLEAQGGQIDTDALDIAAWQGLLGTSISITGANVTNTGLGFTTVAYNRDGSVGTVAVRTGTPPGFGVAAAQLSGDPAEIGEQGGQAERLEITFAGTVTSANVWLAWQNPSESALVNFYRGTTLVGSWSRTGGTDTIDGPFTMTATGGVPFDRMVFTVPTNNAFAEDDYLVNRVDFVLMRPPQAQNDAFTTNEDVAVSGNLFANNGSGVDRDPDGDTFTVTSNTAPANGTVVVNPNGSFTYTPNANYSGTDSFTYTIRDTDGGTSTATVTFTVNQVNDRPTDGNETNSVTEDTTLTVPAATGLLANATDVEGNALTVSAFTVNGTAGTIGSPLAIAGVGSITVSANGAYSFTPLPNFTGAIPVVNYTVSDGQGGTDTSTLTLTMVPVNDAPVDGNESNTVTEDTTLTVPAATGLLANASDVEGNPLSVSAFTVGGTAGVIGTPLAIPGVGSITVSANGSYSFTPAPNYVGAIPVVNYTVSDGQGGTDTSTLTLTMVPVNDAPVDGNESNT
ncbi:MAG: tandem-95 repeat protein, partial [Hydrogenophaga sp.]|nr:tandem-95 repeat protein [Hydrogenophaga sp.]